MPAMIDTLRRCARPALLSWLLLAAILPLGPGTGHAQVVLDADFNAETPGQPPAASPLPTPPNDAIRLNNCDRESNTCLVQGPTGPAGSPGFINNSLRVGNPKGFGSDPFVELLVDPAAQGAGGYVVTWSTLAEQVGKAGITAVLGPGSPGPAAFTLNHQRDGRIWLQSGTGFASTGIGYAPGVARTFDAFVRVGRQTFDLAIDGVQVACGQPFYQTAGFTRLDRLVVGVLPPPSQPDGEAYAWDSIRVERTAAENAPPVLDPPIGPRSVEEGRLLQFTVSARDCDGDPLTFSASPLPIGAGIDPATGQFIWRPDASQAGQYFITFTVTDPQGASDSEEVLITVIDRCADADGDGVPDACDLDGGGTISGPSVPNSLGLFETDNCPVVPNPSQSDVDQNGIGDACDNAAKSQGIFTLSTNKLQYEVGELIVVRPSLTVSLLTGCALVPTPDAQRVRLTLFTAAGQEVPPDQHAEGDAADLSSFFEACAGSPATTTADLALNGPTGPVRLVAAGSYVLTGRYSSLGFRDPSLDEQGQCTEPNPADCGVVLQLESDPAQTSFSVIDIQSAIDKTRALCAVIDALLIDPKTKKSLSQKCADILDKLLRRAIGTACNDLQAFLNQVKAAFDKKTLTAAQATDLTNRAREIRALLACQ
jgi:hypothetical protein